MKSVISILVAVLLSNSGLCNITNDLSIADNLYASKQYNEAQNAYEKIIESYPLSSLSYHVYYNLADSYRLTHKSNQAIAAYQKLINTFIDAPINTLALSQFYIGFSLRGQNKLIDAEREFNKVFTNYKTASNAILSLTKFNIADLLDSQGKFSEANLAYIESAIAYGFINLSYVNQSHSRIKPYYLEKDVYQNYLQKLLMTVPATEENAEFLGKIKSQLNVLQ